MKDQVTIYVLIDPITTKVRYIGRTRCDLKKRLREHLSKARNNYDNTHKSSWIRSLIKMNSKPFIRKLCIIQGWKKSHEFERSLINKYKDRLLNHDDRGEGGYRVYTEEQKKSISKSLKKYFEQNKDNLSYCREVYAYNFDGSFYERYPSIKTAARLLGISVNKISRSCNGETRRPQIGKMQFNYNKVESMRDWTKQEKINRRLVW